MLIYFAIWIGCAVRSQHLKRDTGDAKADASVRFLAGPMILAYVFSMTFAAVDWAMSLDPHWFSTMFRVIFIAGQAISTLAFAIVICTWLRKDEQFGKLFTSAHFHDLGTFMFAFSMFWTYVSFSQYLIIWSGNLSERRPGSCRTGPAGRTWRLGRRPGLPAPFCCSCRQAQARQASSPRRG